MNANTSSTTSSVSDSSDIPLAQSQSLCPSCSSVATSFCKTCRCIRYCSTMCQKDDWPIHKLLCKTLVDFQNKNRPGPDYYRAIYFSVDQRKPCFVWIYPRLLPYSVNGKEKNALVTGEEEFVKLGDDRPLVFVRHQERNEVLKRSHQRICHVGALENTKVALVYVGNHSKSLAKIDAELPEALKGPHLYHGWMADLNMIDFRHIVDWMRTDFDNYQCKQQQQRQHRTGIDGVRINCHGDIHISERPDFEPWLLENDHFVPSPNPEPRVVTLDIPIAAKLGFPLIIHSLWRGLSWRDRRMVAHGPDAELTEEHNYSLQSMNPETWRAMASSLAVARQDRKPLHVAHVHALTLYCIVLGNSWGGTFPTRKVGEDPLRDVTAEADRLFHAKAAFVLEKANKEEFVVFWNIWMLDFGKNRYGNVASPYDV